MKAIRYLVVILAFVSCNRSGNYIIPVDYRKYYEGITSLTEKESQELHLKIDMEWYNNTIEREIPDIQIKDLNGKAIRLKKWLKKETILVFTNTHCGFGKEEVEKEFPNAINKMKDELEGINILCLVELSENSNLQETVDYAKCLQDKYHNIFIIDQKDALRTNLTACPTKFFIDKRQIVRHVHVGMSMEQSRREENMRKGLSLMRKEKS
ncbi:MAG: redoxin domain-containing protein [Bacteroidales bacterium]|nr:redoxin domain-containing protein [Bacteroidales bacterium]